MKSITVVIPSYNSIKFIRQCVESVLQQTYPNMSILLADNESTDGTYEYLQTIKDPRVQLISLPNTIPNGYREAIEYVFQNAQTDFITFVCSDDFIAPYYIQKCMNIINKNDEIQCLQSPIVCVDVMAKQTNQVITKTYLNLEEFKHQFLTGSPVNNPTVIYSKSLWPLIDTGREAHATNNLPDIGVGDYDLWGKFADNDVFIYPAKAFLGYYYRWHPGQATWKVHGQSINYNEIIQSYWRNKWKM